MAERREDWPAGADMSNVGDISIYVYDKDTALLQLPPSYFDDAEVWLDAASLRALAKELVWAAERLESRQSAAPGRGDST